MALGTTGITTAAVGTALGTSSRDVGTLCTHSAINKWSKKKPVSYAKSSGLTDAEFKLANYGLSTSYFSTSNTAKALLTAAQNGTDFYPYIKPSGGSNSPYRLGDFRGYNHSAVAPYSIDCSSTMSVQSFPATLPYTLWVNSDSDIKLTDLAAFEDVTGNTDMHLGVLWTKGDGTYYLYNSAKDDDITSDVALNLTIPSTGTYHFLGVFTNYSDSYGNVDVTSMAETFIPVPNTYCKTVISQKTVYGEVTLSNLTDSYLYYSWGSIYGFSNFPTFTITFPNGSTPACTYRFGLYVRAELDGSTYGGTYWYDDELISHSAGSTTQTVQFNNFPSFIALSDILGAIYDENMSVDSITITPDLERVSGQGYLYLPTIDEYTVTI